MGRACFRQRVVASDRDAIRDLVAATGFFSTDEVDVAAELLEECVAYGPESGYFFVLAEDETGRLLGYACYGPVPCTQATYDLYWIAVRPDIAGQGLGRAILDEVEHAARAQGARKLVAETSSRAQYAPTRGFYERRGFAAEARIRDYYGPGDDLVVYTKVLA